MKARIVNYRRGRRRQDTNQMVLEVAGSETREAAKKFIGKTVVWKNSAGKEMTGTVTAAHGNSGAIHAHFTPGLPGQAIGAEVELK